MSNTTDTSDCTSISAQCPVEATIYGYYPSLGANAFFAAIFGVLCIANIGLGLRYKTWTFLIALSLGAFAECLGYIGRVILHNNPWSNTGFEIQICCLIIAPAFMAAGVYLTLKHFVSNLSPSLSLFRPKYYTWIFICCDLLSLILQGAGGGIAATATDDHDKQKIGNDLMMAGIVWQVITLLVFGILVGSYVSRLRSVIRREGLHCPSPSLLPTAPTLLRRSSFKLFMAAILVAFLTIFIRCVYRIAEMANGWRNSIMQDETDFIVLDGVMVLIATVCLTVFHPGWAFPEMQSRAYKPHRAGGTGDVEAKNISESESESSPERGRPVPVGAEHHRGGIFGRT